MDQQRKYEIACRSIAQLDEAKAIIRRANEVNQAYVHEYIEDGFMDATVFVFNKHPYKPRIEEWYQCEMNMETLSRIVNTLPLEEVHTEERWIDTEQEYGEALVTNRWYRIK